MFRAQLAEAEKGNTQAQVFVRDCYYHGDEKEGVTVDLALAFKFCRMAADGGDPISQLDLGGFYDRGDGVERDDMKATAWYLRAAEGGNSEAQFYTAQRHENGNRHDAPDMKQAVK
jgi:hypothetical protein